MPAAVLDVPPPAADPAAVARTLGAARWRLGTRRLFEWATQAAHLVLTGLVIAVAARLLLGRTPPLLTAWDAVLAVAAGLVFVGQRVWTRWPTVPETARILDRRAVTRDRFTTALGLGGRADLGPVESLAAAECARFAGRFPLRRWTPLAVPRAARWLPVPLITLSMLLWRGSLPDGAGQTDLALQAVLHAQADELQRAADTVAGKKDDADRRLAEELARAAERLRQAAAARNPDPEAARRDALRELSDLQNRLRRLAAGAGPSPAEIAALAAALQRDGSEAARAAAEALRRGDHGEAARQLENLLAELKKNADPAAALERLARAMQDQAGRLSEAERGELGRQMARAQADAQQREELMKKIADLLRQQRGAAGGPGQSAANRGGSQGAGSGESPAGGEGAGSPIGGLSNQQLQSLLNSLENMKNGLNGNGGPGQGGMSLSLQDAPPPGAVQTSPPGAGNSPAGGAPGSERDPGTSELGNRPATAFAPPERVARATGQLGEGETLSDFAPSTDPAAPARAGRRYREIYDAMAPAARDSVRQENIPLGSRVLVERYFQNIRPPD